MRILVVGDFHGKFPEKIEKVVVKENVDIVISVGDYLPFSYRKMWFKYCFAQDRELWEVIGKKKYKRLVDADLKGGEDILKKLNKLPARVLTVLGNVDYPLAGDVMDEKKPNGKRFWKWDWDRPEEFIKILGKYKNIERIDYSYSKYKDFIFIGMRGHSFPGHVKSRGYKKHKIILERLFRKFNRENKEKKVIFVSHNVPFRSGLDKINIKAHKRVRRRYGGSKLARAIIQRYQPILAIGGHIH